MGDVANISTDFDAVGNLTSRGDTLHDVAKTFAYDPNHDRAQQTDASGTTLYANETALGAMAERFQPTTGAVTWRNYILADGKIVAERTSTGSTVHVRYFVLDHLGSTVALTDETGALAESDAYDAWGKQRNASTGAGDTTCSLPATSFSNRGFSGHEQMPDGLCLVNMNARIYDPAIGRFLSPDDVIPDAYNTQAWNRYTYVENNPLSYADPTGHAADVGNNSALANMSSVHITVFVDSDGEMHAMGVTGAAANMINHALNDAATHGGLSGAHIALGFSSSGAIGAAVVFTGSTHVSQSDIRSAVAGFVDKHNDSGAGKFANAPVITTQAEWDAANHNNPELAATATTAANRALAPIANTVFGNMDEMDKAWSKIVDPIANALNVEIASRYFENGDKNEYRFGSATSLGNPVSVSPGLGGVIPGWSEVGWTHTHLYNSGFSGDDLARTFDDSRAYHRAQTAYVSWPNGQVYKWSSENYYNHYLPNAKSWQDYDRFKERIR